MWSLPIDCHRAARERGASLGLPRRGCLHGPAKLLIRFRGTIKHSQKLSIYLRRYRDDTLVEDGVFGCLLGCIDHEIRARAPKHVGGPIYQGLRVYPDTQIDGLERRFRGGGCTWHISDPLRRSYHRRYTTRIWFSNARLQPYSWFGESQSRSPTKTKGEATRHGNRRVGKAVRKHG